MSGDSLLTILRRLIDPSHGTFPRAAAEAVLQISFAQSDKQRVEELQRKSNEGTLSAQEAEELDSYIVAADFLALLQSKARLSLKQQPSAA